MFVSRYMPCERCGESLDRTTPASSHDCDPARVARFQMFALRDDIASFEAGYQAYLRSAQGRFEVWLARRHVRGAL